MNNWTAEGEPTKVSDDVFIHQVFRTADGRRFTVAAVLATGTRVSLVTVERQLARQRDAFCEANRIDPATVTEVEAAVCIAS